MSVPRQDVRRENGDTQNTTSSSCPKCGSIRFSKSEPGAADFDEKGWFHGVNFVCQSIKCGHKWIEKVSVQQNGKFLR